VIGPVLAEGGAPIVIGRAVGPVCCVEGGADPDEVPRGSVLVIPHATPEFGHLLPRVEGLITEHGSVAGHLASLAREFGVPSVFGMVGAASRLPGGELVSLDAGRCKVYAGNAWADEEPAVRRLERERRATSRSPLHRLVLSLELTNPRAPNFRPGGCRSIHDIVRFCHERGIAALFEAGAWAGRPERSGAQQLDAPQLPNQIWVLDIGGGVAPSARGRREVAPGDVVSLPFRALWRGMTAPGVEWRGRTGISLRGFASVVSSSLLEAEADPSALAAAAYMIVASHHLNLNARLAYHYAMIDARVDEVSESNHVRFRFWGGGAMPAQRDLRALFLDKVLRSLGFTVERRGDLVAAALLRHPLERSEQALEALGTLMGCARQLDMLLDSDARVEHYIQRFLAGDHEAFA
jgi:pyruvate,water dikinase